MIDENRTWKKLHDSKLISTSASPFREWISDEKHESWMVCECLTGRILREKEMEIIRISGGNANLEKGEMIKEMNAAIKLDGSNVLELLNTLFCQGHAKTINELSDEEILERSYMIEKAILLIQIHASEHKASISIRRAKRGPKEFDQLDKKYKPRIRVETTPSKFPAKMNPETAVAILAKSFGITVEELRKRLVGS